MHANERETLILSMLNQRGFVTFRELEAELEGSPATIRRDLERMARAGKLVRVHGGAKLREGDTAGASTDFHLAGVPFHENIARNTREKERIGRAAAARCKPGEGIMIDGGSTTLQMCPHLSGLGLSVLTNSLHIVAALIQQSGTRVLVPSGAVFPEQNIVLPVFGDDGMPRFHAGKLFMGAAAIGPAGLMQADPVLVASERRLVERAEEIIVLVDSSKFEVSSGNVVCELSEIDLIITDAGISGEARDMLSAAGVAFVIAD